MQFEVTFLKQKFWIISVHAVCQLLFTLMVNFKTLNCALDGCSGLLASLRVETITHYKRGDNIKMFLNEKPRIVRSDAWELLQ